MIKFLRNMIFKPSEYLNKIDMDEVNENVVVETADSKFTDAPYEFSVSVICSYSLIPYDLTFKPNSPFELCVYRCRHCEGDIELSAIQVHDDYRDSDSCLIPVRNRGWFDQRLFQGVSNHTITVKEHCAKITSDDFKRYSRSGY